MTTLIITSCLILAEIVYAAWDLNRLKHLKLRINCLNKTYDQLFRKYISASDRASKSISDVDQLRELNEKLKTDLFVKEKECKELREYLTKAETHIVILRQEINNITTRRKK